MANNPFQQNVPDFNRSIPQAPNNLIAAEQQRVQQEEQMHNDELKRGQMVMDSITSTANLVSNAVEKSKERQKADFIKNLGSIMAQDLSAQQQMASAQTFEKPISSMVPETYTAAQPPQPTPEGNVLQTMAATNPNEFMKQFGQSVLTSPQDKASSQLKDLEAQQRMRNLKKNAGPVSEQTKELINATRQDMGLPPLIMKNLSEDDALTHLGLLEKRAIAKNNQSGSLTPEDRERLAPLAKAVIEGRALPNQMTTNRSSDKIKIVELAAELDPSFDLSVAPQRIAIRRDYSPAGASGRALNSLNTVIGHLDTLSKKLSALDNKRIVRANSLKNFLKSETGSKEVVGFNATKALVVGELGKIAQGVGTVTDAERKHFEEALNASQSVEQANEAIETFIDLIKSRTDALRAGWSQTMGDTKPPAPFLNEKSKKLLEKHGYDPETMEKRSGSSEGLKIDRGALEAELRRRGL